jgi:hypothetical protein
MFPPQTFLPKIGIVDSYFINRKTYESYGFIPVTSKEQILTVLNGEFKCHYDRMFKKSIVNIAHLLDEYEIVMDDVDKARERIIFHPKRREDILNSFVKRYILDNGEKGAKLSAEELAIIQSLNLDDQFKS